MRELTALEIERFDFTGLVPDMNMPERRTSAAVAVKTQRLVKLPRGKRGPQIGVARTA